MWCYWRSVFLSVGSGFSCCLMRCWTPCTVCLSTPVKTTTVCRLTLLLPSTPTTSPTSASSDASLPWWDRLKTSSFPLHWTKLCSLSVCVSVHLCVWLGVRMKSLCFDIVTGLILRSGLSRPSRVMQNIIEILCAVCYIFPQLLCFSCFVQQTVWLGEPVFVLEIIPTALCCYIKQLAVPLQQI